MNTIENHIRELLLEYDCISIPAFGGMVAQRFGAEINPSTHILRPPSKRISFHKDLAANAHLLVNKVAQTTNLNIREAEKQIAKTVAVWQKSLAAGESVKLPGIGRFYLDNSGSISFNQSLESNFELDAFGFDIFRLNAIKREIEVKESIATAIVRHTGAPKTGFPFWRSAAVFIGIGALLTIGFLKSEFTLPTNPLANFNPLAYSRVIQDEARYVPRVQPKETTISYEEVVVPEMVIEAPKPVATEVQVAAVSPSKASFYVVVGSFKEAANAQDLMADLRTQGHNPTLLQDGGTYYKVSLESFKNRTEATMALRAYKLSVNKGAWIYSH